MSKKVKVTTKCGETFFYDHDQEVDTVEIVESPKNITHLDSKLSSVIIALQRFAAKERYVHLGVYAGDNNNTPREGHAEKMLMITFLEPRLQKIMQLIQEESK